MSVSNRSDAEWPMLTAVLHLRQTSNGNQDNVQILRLPRRRQFCCQQLSSDRRQQDNRKIVGRALLHILHVVLTFLPLAIVRIVEKSPGELCLINKVEVILESTACLAFLLLPVIYVKKNNGLRRLLRMAEYWADI